MTLLAPWALWLSAVGAAVVALYLLKIKRRRETVPALEFWLQLAGRTQVRSLFQRLKRWVSLALWLLIVACLLLATGNPIFSLGRIKPRSIAVILDNSASMTTLESDADGKQRSRLAEAIAALATLTSERPVSDEWMLIEAARRPRVLVPWTLDRKAIRDAASAVTPYVGSADLAAARELAGQLLTGKERPTIVILTDGAAGQARELAAKDASVVFWSIGKTNDNLGIVRLRVRPNREQALHQAYVRVVNASTKPVEAQAVFEIDGSTTAVEPMAIEANAAWEKTVSLSAPAGGVLRVWIDRPDAMAVDNEAFAVLEPMSAASVLLVTPPNESFYYEQALAAMDTLVDADASAVIDADAFNRRDAQAPVPDLTIFNNCKPAKLPPRGQFVFVNDWPAEIPARVGDTIDHPDLTLVRRDHPLCRYLNVSAATLARAKRVDLPERADVLARATDGSPLMFLIQQPDRTSLCLAFDVMESDLPFRNAFPLLLRNAVSHLSRQRAAWIADQYRVGDAIEPLRPLPEGLTQVTVTRPDPQADAPPTVPVKNGRFLFDATERPGALRFAFGEESVYTAVNLTDATESRIAPDKATASPQEQLALSGRLFGTVPWLALATLGTLLIAFEWLTYHQRWTE